MNQADLANIRESRIRTGVVDFLRKKISKEDLESIRNQAYDQYREEQASATRKSVSTMSMKKKPSTSVEFNSGLKQKEHLGPLERYAQHVVESVRHIQESTEPEQTTEQPVDGVLGYGNEHGSLGS